MPQVSRILPISAVAVVVLLVAAAIYFLKSSEVSVVVGLPMLSVGAVIVLVILLCLMAVVFTSYNLQDKTQALALPEGSIRAVIALMLIVLFAILCIYLYGSLANGQLTHMGVVDATTLNLLIGKHEQNIVSTAVPGREGFFDVWFRQGTSQEGIDFAKQLLVLVGTLVTSISSFYFGSRAASPSNEQASATSAPVVDSFIPTTYTRGAGPQTFTVQGANLNHIIGVKLSSNEAQVVGNELVVMPDQVIFKADFPPAQIAGVWKLTLTDSKFGEQQTTQFLTVS